MAYDALVAVWNTTGAPADVVGTALTGGMTAQQKLAAINGWTVPTGSVPLSILSPSAIINAIVPADLAALTQLQTLQMSLLLSGAQVDVSPGTTIRAGIQNLFAGKTQTLSNLAALVGVFVDPRRLWTVANGLPSPLGTADLTIAGLS